jgi:phage gp16-like protein
MQVSGAPDRRALLARIHIARKEMALDEASYRAILLRVGKHESAAEIDDAALHRVLGEFKRLGWVPQRPAAKRVVEPHVAKIYALWGALAPHVVDASLGALSAFCRRQTGVAAPAWLSPEQAIAVIEGLKAWLAREKARERAGE